MAVEGFSDGSGLVAVVGHTTAADLALRALEGLSHRGGRAVSIAASDGASLQAQRGASVADLLRRVPGDKAIGLVTGGLSAPGVSGLPLDGGDRMVLGHSAHGALACAVAGRFTNGSRLRRERRAAGALFQSESDAELLLHLIANSAQETRVNRLVDALWQVQGAFSALILGADMLVAIRDPRGFRPLFIGEADGAVVVTSEEAVLSDLGGRRHHTLQPGEMWIAHPGGNDMVRPFPPQEGSFCLQEILSLARPESAPFERPVYRSRVALGERLAHDAPAQADFVVAEPEDAAFGVGYARASNLPWEPVIRGGRVASVVVAKRVVLVARAILTGHELKQSVARLRAAGAVEVHVRVATPPVQKPCLYGVPSPTAEELAWSNRPDPVELALWLDASSVQYQAIQGLRGVLGANSWCDACLSGEQPVVPEEPDDQLPLF